MKILLTGHEARAAYGFPLSDRRTASWLHTYLPRGSNVSSSRDATRTKIQLAISLPGRGQPIHWFVIETPPFKGADEAATLAAKLLALL